MLAAIYIMIGAGVAFDIAVNDEPERRGILGIVVALLIVAIWPAWIGVALSKWVKRAIR